MITNLRLDLRFKLYSPRPRLQTPTSFLADSQPRKNRNIMDRSCDCGMEIMAQLARNKQQLEWKTNCNLHNSSINAVLVLIWYCLSGLDTNDAVGKLLLCATFRFICQTCCQTWVLWRAKLEQILPVEISYFTVSGPSSFIHCHLFKNKFIFTFCEFSTQVL